MKSMKPKGWNDDPAPFVKVNLRFWPWLWLWVCKPFFERRWVRRGTGEPTENQRVTLDLAREPWWTPPRTFFYESRHGRLYVRPKID